MKLFPWQKPTVFFSEAEQQKIVAAIQAAEVTTSGEVRVFVESKCRFMDALDRAQEIFTSLKMNNTALRNAVLVYVAVKDKQVAVFADEGIHQKAGQQYWHNTLSSMLQYFKKQNVSDGIAQAVTHIGESLQYHFPYDKSTDKNELPDEIVFGK